MLMDSEKVSDYISWEGEWKSISGYPVFIKPERGVLNLENINVAGPVRRGGRVRQFMRALRATSDATSKNVARFEEGLFSLRDDPVVLVVGGGQVGLGTKALYDSTHVNLIAFDIYGTTNVHFIADGHDIPISDSSVDGVLVQAVLEHVLDPSRVVSEIARVLTPNGIVYAETPFMQHVHEGAYDFTRFTHSGHRWLFRDFECIDSGTLTGPATYFVWATSALVTGLFRSRLAGRVAKIVLHWVTYLDRLVPEAFKVDGACAVYFLGRLGSESIGPAEIVEFYRGAQR